MFGFKRDLGYWQLTAIGLGGVIGSGWLLGALYAANAAGPASLITWVVGGLALLVIALVMVELGGPRCCSTPARISDTCTRTAGSPP